MSKRNRPMTWLQVLTVIAGFAAGAVHAQMIGDLQNDMALLDAALVPALSATGEENQDKSRLAMEELYHLWLTFRRMNIDAHPDDARLVSDLDAIEARLWAASQRVDSGKLSDAHAELEAARILLLMLRERYGSVPRPGAARDSTDRGHARHRPGWMSIDA